MNDLDKALARFGSCDVEYGAGIANHGPMAAEALVALGHAALIPTLVDVYAPRLRELEPGRAISAEERRACLGDTRRSGDQIAGFEVEIEERGWRTVLRDWLPLLLPGLSAADGHAMLRTAHAARALESDDNGIRRSELAFGLGYWASRYQDDGELHAAPATVDASAGTPADAIGSAAREGVELYLAHPEARIEYSHCVTTPSALRLLAPHLTDRDLRRGVELASRATSAMHRDNREPRSDAAMGGTQNPEVVALAESTAEIRYRAACSVAEHAILLAEACLREDRAAPDLRLRLAAADAALSIEGSRAARG